MYGHVPLRKTSNISIWPDLAHSRLDPRHTQPLRFSSQSTHSRQKKAESQSLFKCYHILCYGFGRTGYGDEVHTLLVTVHRAITRRHTKGTWSFLVENRRHDVNFLWKHILHKPRLHSGPDKMLCPSNILFVLLGKQFFRWS